jgi:hypothetical protein
MTPLLVVNDPKIFRVLDLSDCFRLLDAGGRPAAASHAARAGIWVSSRVAWHLLMGEE